MRRRLKTVASLDFDTGSDQATIAVEKFAFMVGFIIRKLVESKKLSDEFERTSVPVKAYIRRRDHIIMRSWDRNDVSRFYDLENHRQSLLSIIKLCNALIHSHAFVTVFDGEVAKPDGILFNSDRTKNHELLFVSLDDLMKVTWAAVNDDVVTMQITLRDNDEEIIKKSRK
ncbi:MAG: hypothetical protein EXR50_03030 [Dehalococcoidia bacterium]|nr:hypothetical protein [Dehalococcoidia bacterium]